MSFKTYKVEARVTLELFAEAIVDADSEENAVNVAREGLVKAFHNSGQLVEPAVEILGFSEIGSTESDIPDR